MTQKSTSCKKNNNNKYFTHGFNPTVVNKREYKSVPFLCMQTLLGICSVTNPPPDHPMQYAYLVTLFDSRI
jgi:hypothetical protein